jgi:hypothetical protein
MARTFLLSYIEQRDGRASRSYGLSRIAWLLSEHCRVRTPPQWNMMPATGAGPSYLRRPVEVGRMLPAWELSP